MIPVIYIPVISYIRIFCTSSSIFVLSQNPYFATCKGDAAAQHGVWGCEGRRARAAAKQAPADGVMVLMTKREPHAHIGRTSSQLSTSSALSKNHFGAARET